MEKAAEDATMKHQRSITTPETLSVFFDRSKSVRDRAFAILQFARGQIPELESVYKKFLYNTENFPFAPEDLSFKGKIGAGMPSVVYLLESRGPEQESWVLKVLQKPEENIEALLVRAKKERSDYEKIKGWYQSVPDLIPNEFMVIMENPRKGKGPALVILQKFFGYDLKNFFDIPEQELIGMLDSNPELKKQVQAFARVTLDKKRETGEVADIAGYKNLVIAKDGERECLRFIDPHWIHSSDNQSKGDTLWIDDCLARLKKIV